MSQRGTFLTGGGGGGVVFTLQGNTGGKVGPDGTGNIHVVGTGIITVTDNPGTNTLTISSSGGSGGVSSITGNTGPAQTGAINLITANSTPIFAGSGGTITVNFALTSNLLIGSNGNITVGTNNVGLGNLSLNAVQDGVGNTCIGSESGQVITSANYNSSCGWSSLRSLQSGTQNCAFGVNSLYFLQFGNSNICLGTNSGSSYTTTESNNICIGDSLAGLIGESSVMRLGNTQTSTYIAGIAGVSVSNLNMVTINTSNGQMGSQAVPTNITSITAGLNIAITGTPTVPIVSSSQDQYLTNYNVANASPYTVTATDFYITVDTSTIPITIQLPDAPTIYRRFVIKDSAGNAAVQNVTVTTVSGVKLIDGATTFVMNTNYEAIELVYDNFGYQVF